jgi:hypothetical protein
VYPLPLNASEASCSQLNRMVASWLRRSITANRRSITANGNKALSSVFTPSDRPGKASEPADKAIEPRRSRHGSKHHEEEGTAMKKFGFATIIASGLIAAVLGFAAPAANAAPVGLTGTTISAGIDHHAWLDQITPQVAVPQVDTTVHQSR